MAKDNKIEQAGVDKNVKVKDMMSRLIDERNDLKLKEKQLSDDIAGNQAEIEGLFQKYYPKKKKLASKTGNTVTLVKKVKINYNIKKLKSLLKRLGMDKDLIHKDVKLDDVKGLAAYVKKLGGDPKIFRSFLTIEEYVDNKEIDALYDDESLDYVKDIKPCIDSVKITKSLR